jgi:hypothetical protein
MVSHFDTSILKAFFKRASKDEQKNHPLPKETMTYHTGHQKRWQLKHSTDPSSSLPSFCWTKTRTS